MSKIIDQVHFQDIRFDFDIVIEGQYGQFKPSGDGAFESGDYRLEVAISEEDDCGAILTLELARRDHADFNLKRLAASAVVPVVGVHQIVGYPFVLEPDFAWHHSEQVSVNYGLPFLQARAHDGQSRFFMGALELVRDYEVTHEKWYYWIGVGIPAVTDIMEHSVYTITTPAPENATRTDRFVMEIYISRDSGDWYEELARYRELIDDSYGIEDTGVTEKAQAPVWCSWYSHLCNPSHDEILKNANLASEMGFGTLILDGGWFTPWDVADAPAPSMMSWAGNWVAFEEKFPDLRATMDGVREAGLLPVMWIGPMRHGHRSQDYERIKDLKIVTENGETKELCPRVDGVADEVRRVVVDVAKRYNLGGLKIDFLDELRFVDCKGAHEHDFPDISSAMFNCMDEMHEGLMEIDPEFWIEYRQRYATPLTRQFATCLRAIDAPHDHLRIRRLVTMLKPFAGRVPVHADPIYWHPDEPIETVAKLCSTAVLGCVPQVSVRLDAISEKEKQVLAAWIGFYNENRKLSLFGDYTPLSLDGQYANFRIHDQDAQIFGIYTAQWPAVLPSANPTSKTIWIVNGTSDLRAAIRLENLEGDFSVTISDVDHAVIEDVSADSQDGEVALDLDVPCGGLIKLQSIEK